MKAARLHEYGHPLVIDDVPTPLPGPGEVLVRVGGAGFCHSDIHVIDGEIKVLPRMPLTLGHENAGIVAALEQINDVSARLKRGDVRGRAVIQPAA